MLCPDTRKVVKFLTSVIMFVPSEKPSWADLVEEGEEGTAEIILLIESLATCRSQNTGLFICTSLNHKSALVLCFVPQKVWIQIHI